MNRETCDECAAAQASAFHPIYSAACRGCAVRSLAGSPAFYTAGMDGGNAAPYRKLLASVFGDAWRDGHEAVLSERKRQVLLAKSTTKEPQ